MGLTFMHAVSSEDYNVVLLHLRITHSQALMQILGMRLRIIATFYGFCFNSKKHFVELLIIVSLW